MHFAVSRGLAFFSVNLEAWYLLLESEWQGCWDRHLPASQKLGHFLISSSSDLPGKEQRMDSGMLGALVRYKWLHPCWQGAFSMG